MQPYPTVGKLFGNSLLAVALPLLAVALTCSDSLRALVIDPLPTPSLLETAIAGRQDDGLEETLSAHYVQLDSQNRLVGKVTAIQRETGVTIPVPGLDVKLVRRSQEISRGRTDVAGNFVTGFVAPGAYTLCISGAEGFLAYGVQVIESDDVPFGELPMPDLGADTSRSIRSGGQFVVWQDAAPLDTPTEITAAVIPPTHNSLQEIMNGIPAGTGLNLQPSAGTQINVEKSVVAGGFKVNLQPDGTLAGRIAPLVSDADQPIRLREMNIYLIDNDQIIAQVLADDDGNFVFNNVRPGVYGFAAAGRDGFAALSFQAVQVREDENAARQQPGVFRPVNTGPGDAAAETARNGTDVLNVAICPPEDIPWLRREIDNLVNPPAAGGAGGAAAGVPQGFGGAPGDVGMGGPGGFGGGYGGYGGGFAGSGFEGLIGLALTGWVISELSSDATVIPPPMSPFQVPVGSFGSTP
jgi:hypothetical protein